MHDWRASTKMGQRQCNLAFALNRSNPVPCTHTYRHRMQGAGITSKPIPARPTAPKYYLYCNRSPYLKPSQISTAPPMLFSSHFLQILTRAYGLLLRKGPGDNLHARGKERGAREDHRTGRMPSNRRQDRAILAPVQMLVHRECRPPGHKQPVIILSPNIGPSRWTPACRLMNTHCHGVSLFVVDRPQGTQSAAPAMGR